MSIEALFDHRCDIYHITEGDKSPGFNLPSSPSFDYPTEADEKCVPCHFNAFAPATSQGEPQNILTATTKLNLPVGTDIRMHDKVVEYDSGLEYTAVTPPQNIRGNHIIIYVERLREQQPL